MDYGLGQWLKDEGAPEKIFKRRGNTFLHAVKKDSVENINVAEERIAGQ